MSYNLNGPELEEILQLDFRRKKKERKKWIVSANERPPSPVHLPQVTALWAPAPPVCSLRPFPPIAIGQAAAAHSIGGRAEARAASLRLRRCPWPPPTRLPRCLVPAATTSPPPPPPRRFQGGCCVPRK